MSLVAMQAAQDPWSQTVHSAATAESLRSLLAREIAGICVPDFLTSSECRELTARMKEVEFAEYQNVVWKKQWKQEHDIYKISGSYGYDPKVIEGIPVAQITPQSGMLMIINSQNFHQVLPSSGLRLAMSGAVGTPRQTTESCFGPEPLTRRAGLTVGADIEWIKADFATDDIAERRSAHHP